MSYFYGYLKLQLHATNMTLQPPPAASFWIVGEEELRARHLCIPAGEASRRASWMKLYWSSVLHHVVPLGAHEGHMTVDVHRFSCLMRSSMASIDDKAACAAHTSTENTSQRWMLQDSFGFF